jgi:hypothetical protein
MSGGAGMSAFLATHRGTAKRAWIVELDALGDGELVLSPARRRVPSSSTPAACVRAVAGAAIDSGDVIDVRRRRRPHSDAAVAFRRGTAALTITAGLRASAASEHGEGANAERAARIVARLARTTL